MVWILNRTDVLTVLVWFQTVCKGKKLQLARKELKSLFILNMIIQPISGYQSFVKTAFITCQDDPRRSDDVDDEKMIVK